MARQLYSERVALIQKAREAMLAAVQIYNNPLISFKTEMFALDGQRCLGMRRLLGTGLFYFGFISFSLSQK